MHKFRHQQIPAFRVKGFFPKKTRYCFMPVIYNEGEKFLRQLERMSLRAELADIIVAARESTDGCTDLDALRSCGVQTLLETPSPGAASAIRAGFWHALRQGYEGVVLVDGHNKDGVEAIGDYLKKLEEGYDFVQGSRFMKGGEEKNTPLLRKIGIRLLMAPLLFYGGHFWYTDGTNGFRGYSRRYLEDPRVEPFRNCFTHLNLQYYLSYMAPKIGLRVVEIPVKRVYPDDGTIPTKCMGFSKNFEAFWEMVRTVTGQYDVAST
jgi:dolichol-phosphate mannosyltransferase